MIKWGYSTIGWNSSLQDIFHEIYSLGFDGVEMIDLLDRVRHNESIKETLSEYNLELAAAYFGGSFIQEQLIENEILDFETTVKALAQLGSNYVVVGGGRRMRRRQEGDIKKLISYLNYMGEYANRHGIQMVLHPHFGTLLDNSSSVDLVLENTDYHYVKIAIDIAHFELCSITPLDFIESHFDRIAYVHIKDLSDNIFVELGEGEVSIVECYRLLIINGYNGWITVELDSSADPIISAHENSKFIHKYLRL